MSAQKPTAAEAMSISTGLVGAWLDDDAQAVAQTLATLDLEDLRMVTVAAVRLAAAMLEAEAEKTGADLDAPAAHTYWLVSRAATELGT